MFYDGIVDRIVEFDARPHPFDPADYARQSFKAIWPDQDARANLEKQGLCCDAAAIGSDIRNLAAIAHAASRTALSGKFHWFPIGSAGLRLLGHGPIIAGKS